MMFLLESWQKTMIAKWYSFCLIDEGQNICILSDVTLNILYEM